MVWLEVETKVKVKDPDSLRKKIQKIAKLEKKETRSEDYFEIQGKWRRYKYPKKAFRVRKKPDKFEVNFKKWLKKLWDKDIVVKQEFDFVFKWKEEVEDLLSLFKDLVFEQ